MEKEELLADEVEKFFDQYGYYTPKVNLTPEREETVIVEGDGEEEQTHVSH
jgi:hypothetical protein